MASGTVESVAINRLAFDLRATWQARAMEHAKGRMMLVVASVLAHNYDVEPMIVLFELIRPQYWDHDKRSIKPPFLCSAGKVDKAGMIVADVIMADCRLPERKVMFSSMNDFEYEFRKLADQLKLSDADRVTMFKAAKNWVVADYRLDPTFDPKDPDAKRLVH